MSENLLNLVQDVIFMRLSTLTVIYGSTGLEGSLQWICGPFPTGPFTSLMLHDQDIREFYAR